MLKSLLAAALAAAALLPAATALADRRAYGTTYEAVTAPRGEFDVETWTTFAPEGELENGPASRGVREMIELEYGITNHWDIALYNLLDVTSGDGETGYAGFKVETRYRPTDRGEWFINPVLYLEFQQLFIGDAKQKIEGKLILGKDIGNLNVAANLSLEEERLEDTTWNSEVVYAAGASYAVTPAWMIGAEVFGKAEKEMDEIENRTWVGPAISWAGGGKGALRGVWATLAGGVGLTDGSDSYYGRLIVGFQFH